MTRTGQYNAYLIGLCLAIQNRTANDGEKDREEENRIRHAGCMCVHSRVQQSSQLRMCIEIDACRVSRFLGMRRKGKKV